MVRLLPNPQDESLRDRVFVAHMIPISQDCRLNRMLLFGPQVRYAFRAMRNEAAPTCDLPETGFGNDSGRARAAMEGPSDGIAV